MKTLDITKSNLKGIELAEQIEGEFAATQSIIVQPYPYELLLTPNQFVDLLESSGSSIENMYGSETDQIWRTKEGFVMEIRVKYE